MDLRHRVVMKIPNTKDIKDKPTKDAFTQLSMQLNDMFKNIYDDSVRIRAEKVDTLPTAAAENFQRFFLKSNAGAADTLHICIYDLSDTSFKFKQVTLS